MGFPTMGKVAVLGCGPAGLMAAHAAAIAEYDVHIYSKKHKSPMPGAQYLHAPVPMITPNTGSLINYEFRGSLDEYRIKVYGEREARVLVSPAALSPQHEAWDLRAAYDLLWEIYGGYVQDREIDPRWISELLESGQYDAVLSTLPLSRICKDLSHGFTVCGIWAAAEEDAPLRVADNTVVCEGRTPPGWYRASNVFGHVSMEWPDDKRPPVSVIKVEKPIRTTCDCWPEIHRLGRYGTWTKGVLTHQAFEAAAEICSQLQ